MNHQSTDRLHALDALRSFALLLGLALHAAMSFMPGEQAWIVMDDQRSNSMFLTFFVIHIFRMAVFFMLAGFFGRMVYHRYGAGRFIKSRAKRIALPLVIFWPIVMVLIVVAVVWNAARVYGWPIPEDIEQPPTPDVPLPFPLTHLWFLYVLLWFYAAMLLLRLPVALVDRGEAIRGGLDRVTGLLVHSNLVPVLFGLASGYVLWSNQSWFILGGIPTPDQSLIPNLQAAFVYGLAFAFGWALQRRMDLLAVWRRRWLVNIVPAIVLTVGCLWLSEGLPLNEIAPQSGQSLAYALCYGLAIWFWIAGLTGAALAFLDRHSPTIRYLADSSYWVYIMHLPLILLLQVAVSELPLPAELKFAGILLVTVGFLLATYQLMVRNSFIGWLLNGRRKPGKQGKEDTVPATAAAEGKS